MVSQSGVWECNMWTENRGNGGVSKSWDPFFGGRSNYANVIISHFWRDDYRVPVMGEVIFVGVLFILPLISVEERFGRLNWMRKAVKRATKTRDSKISGIFLPQRDLSIHIPMLNVTNVAISFEIPPKNRYWKHLLNFLGPDLLVENFWNMRIAYHLFPWKPTYLKKIDGWFRWCIPFWKWSLWRDEFLHSRGVNKLTSSRLATCKRALETSKKSLPCWPFVKPVMMQRSKSWKSIWQLWPKSS